MTIRKGPTIVIPDFMLDLCPLHHVALEPVPLWIGECGFSSTRSHMVYQLKSVVEIAPKMDTAFMICICEVKRKLPPTHNPLHSDPKLSRSTFSPSSTPANYLQPITVEGIKWIEVKSVTFNVFLCGSDSKFNFKDTGELYTVRVNCLYLILPLLIHSIS
jgi:hypothetical protein